LAAPTSPEGGFRRTGSSKGPSTTSSQGKDNTKFSGIKTDTADQNELQKKMNEKKISDDSSDSKTEPEGKKSEEDLNNDEDDTPEPSSQSAMAEEPEQD